MLKIFTHSLQNGLTVAVEEIPYLKTASIGLWVNVGARFENRKENGLAHFLEHMAFKGTKEMSALDIAQRVENIGGYMNAYTGREVTNYSIKVLSEDVLIGIDILSDIILNSTFSTREIELERKVIIQEIGMSLDTPDDLVFERLQNVCYPDQPLGRSILGSIDNVKSFTKESFFEFLNKFYEPRKMILCVAGGVDHRDIFCIAQDKLEGLKNFNVKGPKKAKFVGGEYGEKKELEQAHLALAFEAPKCTDLNIYDARVFSAILGGGMSSRLFQEAREKRGLCYSIFSFMETLSDTGTLMIYSATTGKRVDQLVKIVTEQIVDIAENVIEEEVERAKSQIKAGIVMGLESSFYRCERMASSLTVWGRVMDLQEIVEKIEQINTDSVKDFGNYLRHSKKAALSLYGSIIKVPSHADILSYIGS